MILNVDIVNKIATYQKRGGNIVCGNSDYTIKFTFDSEWIDYPEKTARFIWNGSFTDVDFTGDYCTVPIIYDTDEVEVGVYAGELKTTTSAYIGCYRSILCEIAKPSEENNRLHINEAKEAADRAEAAADTATERVEEAVKFATDKVETATSDAANRAEAAAVKAEEAADRAELEGGGISTEVESRLKTLEKWMNDETYVSMTVSLSVSPSSKEYGDSVKNAKLSWSVSEAASAIDLTLPSGDTVDLSKLTSPYTDENEYKVTSQKTWKLAATRSDGNQEEVTTSASVSYYYLEYWGLGKLSTDEGFVIEENNAYDAAFITSLSEHGQATSGKHTLDFDSANNQYAYYAIPKGVVGTKELKFDINEDGFIDVFDTIEDDGKKKEITVTKNGEPVVYYLYRSTNLLKNAEPFTVGIS